jgi:hypothetical protein
MLELILSILITTWGVYIMSIYEQRNKAIEANDADLFNDTLHDDFIFVSHLDGSSMNRSEAAEMFTGMMTNDSFEIHNMRCLYENSDVLVDHAVYSFPDNTKEAVLAYHEIKNGKVIRTETGATLLT